MGIVKVFFTIAIIVLMVSATIYAAEKPAEVKKVNIVRPTHFFSDEVIDVDGGSSVNNISTNNIRRPLGSLTASTSVNSITTVGTTIGTSWYDHHMIESGGRLVATGPRFAPGSDAVVHFVWTGLDGPSYSYLRYYSYNFYNASSGSFASSAPINPQPDSFSGRFLNLDVTLDNRAIIAGHSFDPSTGYLMPHLYWQDTPQAEIFALENRVPDSLIGESSVFTSLVWPKVVYQEGTNTVTHVFAAIDDGINEYPAYIRKVGVNEAGVWDDPIYIVDSCYDPSVDISADYNGDKIAIVWMANLPNSGDCDTCSGESNIHPLWDNDLYYQISNDQGATWEPRINVTRNVNGEAGFRPYSTLSSLIDTDGDLHIIWSGVYWPENPLSVGWGRGLVTGNYSRSIW